MRTTLIAALSGLVLLGLLVMLDAPNSARADVSVISDPEFPTLLSETGFFSDVVKHELSADFHAYSVNVGAWANGAKKLRFFRLRPGQVVTYEKTGPWEFPAGTVFLQTIVLERPGAKRRVETRVIVHRAGGPAFATYVWRKDQTEADRVTTGGDLGLSWKNGYMLWELTPVKKCSKCHNPDTHTVLGLTTQQLNGPHEGKDQLTHLASRGLVRGVPKEHGSLAKLVDPYDDKHTLTERARSYLDTNCSTCHQPGGRGSGTMDLRRGTDFVRTGLDHGGDVLIEGSPFTSWIYKRLIYDDRRRMPPLLTNHMDQRGADLRHDRVKSLDSKQ